MPLDRGHRSHIVSEKKPMDEAYIQAIKAETAKYKAELEEIRQSVVNCNQLKSELNEQIQMVRDGLNEENAYLDNELKNKTNILNQIECNIRAKQDEINAKNAEIESLNDDYECTVVSINEAQDELGNLNLDIHKISNEKTRLAFELQALQNNAREFASHTQAAQDDVRQRLDTINSEIETRLSELSSVLGDIADRSSYCDTLKAKASEIEIEINQASERLAKLNQLNETIERDKLKNTERGLYLKEWSQRLTIDEASLKNRMADLIKRESKLKEAMKT